MSRTSKRAEERGKARKTRRRRVRRLRRGCSARVGLKCIIASSTCMCMWINSTTMCCWSGVLLLPAFVSAPLTLLVEQLPAQLTATHTRRQPPPASHTNTQTSEPPPVRQIHKHIFSKSEQPPSTTFYSDRFPSGLPASCKMRTILAKVLLLAHISSNSICTVCAKT